jgi:ABC-2 type transport system ATP-binding protein
LSEISQTCDRLLVIHEGRLAADGTEESISQGAGGGAAVIELELAAAGAEAATGERARAAIGKVAGVLASRVVSAEGGRVHLEVEATDDRRAEVAKAVIDAGLGLIGLQKKALELESIFQRLVNPSQGGSKSRAA